jgi:hypothetical protein
MMSGFFSMFNNSGQGPMSEKDQEIINAFAEAERMYKDIIQKDIRGAATTDEINEALAQLKKGVGAPDAGSAPTGKHFKYSRDLRELKRTIERRSKIKNNGI